MPDDLITRATFIADNHIEIAISNLETIYRFGEEGEPMEVVPMPKSIKESGVLPDGYCVDFLLDPLIIVHTLAKNGIRYESQLTVEVMGEVKTISNSPENLSIIPVKIWEEKQEQLIESLAPLGPPPNAEDKENYPPKLTSE